MSVKSPLQYRGAFMVAFSCDPFLIHGKLTEFFLVFPLQQRSQLSCFSRNWNLYQPLCMTLRKVQVCLYVCGTYQITLSQLKEVKLIVSVFSHQVCGALLLQHFESVIDNTNFRSISMHSDIFPIQVSLLIFIFYLIVIKYFNMVILSVS